jgi:glycosyltransferase involved in cell wall biosynthesis
MPQMFHSSLKISVITVCYNSAATLADALNSVAGQTWSNVEHIVIDGASTDGTLAVIERYRAGLAKVVSERDAGIYDAMNKGLRLATGDVIGFLNADDVYAGDWVLSHVAKAFLDESTLEAVFGDVEFFRPANPDQPVRRYRSGQFSPRQIAWGWMPAHPTLFLRRQLFERYGLFRSEYRIAGDFELVARMFGRGAVAYRYLPEVLVRMRIGGVSTGGLRNTLRLNREVLRACRENGLASNWLKILSKYPAKLLEYVRK